MGANRAQQHLRLGTELVRSQVAEIGLVSTLLDSGAQDRDDIANDSVRRPPGSIDQCRIPRRWLGDLRADKGMTYPAGRPSSSPGERGLIELIPPSRRWR